MVKMRSLFKEAAVSYIQIMLRRKNADAFDRKHLLGGFVRQEMRAEKSDSVAPGNSRVVTAAPWTTTVVNQGKAFLIDLH